MKHAAGIGLLAIIALFCMISPHLPGGTDFLAPAVSMMVQGFGIAGMLLVPVGIAWLVYEVRSTQKSKTYTFALVSLAALSLVCLIVALVALAVSGTMLAVCWFLLCVYVVTRLGRAAKQWHGAERISINPAPAYLILLPTLILILQLTLAAPMANYSRNRAIANSSEYIADIEAYHAKYGFYPTGLLAQWKDYYPDVAGIEKYHYALFGESYNLFFEQPRFVLDDLGTREWVVYNPKDEHRIYSHTSWFLKLPPEEILDRAQGWYASEETGHAHWKSFLFD